MTYIEAISEMIRGNTPDCIDEPNDLKSANEMNQRAVESTKVKVDLLYEKIENWDCDDDLYELAQWFNELRELVGNDEIDIPVLSGDCFQMDLYNRIESIFPIITCNIDSYVLYRNDDGVFVVETVDSLAKKHLTLEDKRELAHILVDQMEDYQIDEVLNLTWM
jgi:hypothetical protein